MAHGAVFKFRYEGFLGLLKYYLGDWRSFEGWCVSQGCDPQKESTRRMISLMFYFLEKDLTDEGREQLRNSLNNPTPKRRHLTSVKPENTMIKLQDTKRWKAPPGWTPPGWDEEKSYQNSVSFMGFNANPK